MAKNQRDTYEVFHLDHERVSRLISGVCPPGESQVSDASSSEAVRVLNMSLSRQDKLKAPHSIGGQDRMAEKGKAAVSLFEKGYYQKVVEIQGLDLNEAINLTTSRHGKWYLTQNPNVNLASDIALRDTGFRDLISQNGAFYLVMPLGFWDIQDGQWV